MQRRKETESLRNHSLDQAMQRSTLGQRPLVRRVTTGQPSAARQERSRRAGLAGGAVSAEPMAVEDGGREAMQEPL